MVQMPVRRIPLSYRSHITGYQPFIPGTRSIGHESSLERDFVTLCRFDPEVIGLEEQPVTIEWKDANGRHRRYTPDYRVLRRTRVEIIEVKYRSDLSSNWVTYKPAFIAARNWAARQGMRFRIATERYIRCPLLLNAKRLLARMNDPVSGELERRVVETLGRLQPISLANFVEEILAPELPRELVLSALWPLLARRTVITPLDVEINAGSMLSLPGALP